LGLPLATGLPFLTLDRTGHLDPKTLGARVGCILLYLVFGLAQSAMTITLVHQQRKLYMSEIRLGFYTASHIYFAFAQVRCPEGRVFSAQLD
jgi:hypothetical protein